MVASELNEISDNQRVDPFLLSKGINYTKS